MELCNQDLFPNSETFLPPSPPRMDVVKPSRAMQILCVACSFSLSHSFAMLVYFCRLDSLADNKVLLRTQGNKISNVQIDFRLEYLQVIS